MLNISVCNNCISVIPNDNATCPICASENTFYNQDEFIRFTTNYYFNARVRRQQLEYDVEKYGDKLSNFKVERMTIDPTFIFGFITSACIGGATWDVVKPLLKKLYKSLSDNPPASDDENSFEKMALEHAKKELAHLLENDDEIKTLVRQIQEYKNNYADCDVHQYVKQETEFSDAVHLKPYEALISELAKSLESLDDDT